MDFSSFRLWQWMLVGTIAGAAVGFAWSNLPNDIERTGNKQQFINFVNNGSAVKSPQPLLQKIVVLEPERDPSNVLVYPVTFEYLDRGDPRARFRLALDRAAKGDKTPIPPESPKYVKSGIYAPSPFEGYDSVVEFLKKKNASFTDRSGSAKYVPVYYGAGGGFVAIGLIWPGIIRLLISLGLAKAPPPREKKVKAKHRTGEDVDDMLTKPATKVVDGAALGNLNDAMEASLAAGASSSGARGAAGSAEEPVSTLMSGNAHLNRDPGDKPAEMTEQEKKDFAGQYYPVARTTKKDGEAH